jgi:hypothetical protein
MLVLPADHVIANVEAFHAAVAQARRCAQQGCMSTFGVVPGKPETGMATFSTVSNCVARLRPVVAITLQACVPCSALWKNRMPKRRSTTSSRRVLVEQRHVPVYGSVLH